MPGGRGMVERRAWSTSASGNASAGGFTLAEGMAPSAVNDSLREMMAQLARSYGPEQRGWSEFSGTCSVNSQTVVKITGNQTTDYVAGRKIRLRGGSVSRYGEILSSSFTTETTITLTNMTGSLSASQTIIGASVAYDKNLPATAAVGANTTTFSASVYFQAHANFLATPSFSTALIVRGVIINTGQTRYTGATQVLQLTDAGKIVEFNSAAAQVPIVPHSSNVSFPVGTRMAIVQIGAGAVSVSASTGVTLNSYSSFRKLLGQYAAAELYHTSTTDTWIMTGQLTA